MDKRIRDYLNTHGAKAIKLHGGIYGKKGNPDIIGIYRGIPFVIEVKDPNGDPPTDIQEYELDQWQKVGTISRVMTSVDEARRLLQSFDNVHKSEDICICRYEDDCPHHPKPDFRAIGEE